MKKFYIITILAISTIIFLFIGNSKVIAEEISGEKIKLPEPVYDSKISIEKALYERRSVRSYKNEALTLSEVSQLLWSAQGITDDKGHRTAPSAMALYPLEVYIVANNIENLPAGIYKYIPDCHEIRSIMKGDVKEKLAAAGQS
ncbi:MAG: SagB/ThcOx family dehydrogenase, partial [Candidatus Eremiobacterota bacterium]